MLQNTKTLLRITDTPFLNRHVREFSESWFEREPHAEVKSRVRKVNNSRSRPRWQSLGEIFVSAPSAYQRH